MAKRKYGVDIKKLNRLFSEGRGQGKGKDYMPFITIHDFSSRGRVHRIKGMTTSRVHHLLSDGECILFDELDWDKEVGDIREQYPLDRFDTFEISIQLNIRHPRCTDGSPAVLTTDFVIDVMREGRRVVIARTYKPSKDLAKKRTLEKLELERLYWRKQGVDWAIITEKQLNPILSRNVAFVRPFYDLSPMDEPEAGLFQCVADLIISSYIEYPAMTLGAFCSNLDSKLSVRKGLSFDIARHLIASRILITDMKSSTPIGMRFLSDFTLNN